MVEDGMKKKQTAEIALETSQNVVPRRHCKTTVSVCEECACGMLTLEEAVAVACVSSRVIHRWADAALVHFTETPEGLLLICFNSLLRSDVSGATK
jgi:hypothetical protein